MKLEEAKRIGKEFLKKNNIDEREARLLLAFVLNISSDELIRTSEITEDKFEEYQNVLNRRVQGTPFSYITGEKEFMKLKFKVNENVLIPRPETEILVEEALKYKPENVLDVCTGSGCIAISIAYYSEQTNVSALDISKAALEIANENAKLNGVDVEFICSDLFENVNRKYDIIVSNPPYIETSVIDTLEKEVKSEPHIALDGGADGLEFYRRIAKEARKYLKENGTLLFEIGYNQGESVSKLLMDNDYKNVRIIKDLSENDRVCVGNI